MTAEVYDSPRHDAVSNIVPALAATVAIRQAVAHAEIRPCHTGAFRLVSYCRPSGVWL